MQNNPMQCIEIICDYIYVHICNSLLVPICINKNIRNGGKGFLIRSPVLQRGFDSYSVLFKHQFFHLYQLPIHKQIANIDPRFPTFCCNFRSF